MVSMTPLRATGIVVAASIVGTQVVVAVLGWPLSRAAAPGVALGLGLALGLYLFQYPSEM